MPSPRTPTTSSAKTAGRLVSMAFAILAGWLTAAREEQADPRMAEKVIVWIGANLGTDCARVASRAASIVMADTSGDVTVQELADDLQADFLPALVWLTAGVVAEYGDGDVMWLTTRLVKGRLF